jgi:hypothetical protein
MIGSTTELRGVLLALVLAGAAMGQALGQLDSLQLHYGQTITQEDLRRHLTILASDAYEGRETGQAGQKMAAKYIREDMMAVGIPPVPDAEHRGLVNGYEQPFPLEVIRPGGLSLLIDKEPIGFMQEFFYFTEKLQEDLDRQEIIFVGLGNRAAEKNDYVGVDVRDKVVMVLLEDRATVSKTDRPSPDVFQQLSRKAANAEAAGARLLLVASTNAQQMMQQYAHYITTPRMRLGGGAAQPTKGIQTIIIDKPVAEKILAKGKVKWHKALRKAAKGPIAIPCPFGARYHNGKQELQGENILGYIEGTDKKEDLIVITAHYDHIGKDAEDVYNGADDDGSGTVAVLEMAQPFAQAKAEGHGPRRSMLFMPVSGEEKGLLGSEWYSEHPVFPLVNTVANLNIDMIGRTDSLHEGGAPYVYIIGSDRLSTELHLINERANSIYTKLELDNRFNTEDDPNRFYYRSDHYNFAKHGIPVIFYFNGVHADYHQAGDEVHKIRFDLLEQRTRLVFHTAWELANREQRIVVDKPLSEGEH